MWCHDCMQLNLVKDLSVFTKNQSPINKYGYILFWDMSVVVFGSDKRIDDKTDGDVLNKY